MCVCRLRRLLICVCYVWYATTDSEKLVDIVGEWLRYEETSGFVARVHCELCSKHANRLKYLRNYLVHLLLMALQGVLRKHNVSLTCTKRLSAYLGDLYKSTPIGRALSGASGADIEAI